MNQRKMKKAGSARPGIAADHKRLDLESPAARRRATGSNRAAATKVLICFRIDRDVLEWFRQRGRGYQTRINSLLRAVRDASM